MTRLMYTVLTILIFGWFSPATAATGEGFALVETENGTMYLGVGGRGEKFRVGPDEYSVSRRYYPCETCGLSVSRGFAVPVETVQFPVSEIEVQRQGVRRSLKAGLLVLASDNTMYVIEDVFEDGRIVAHRAQVNRNSRNRVNRNFVKLIKENPYILHAEDVSAVQTECFLDYCIDGVYRQVQNVPLCDVQVISALLTSSGRAPSKRGLCNRLNGGLIDGVFSDGTLVFGSNMINPFPPTIHNYYRAAELEVDGDSTSDL